MLEAVLLTKDLQFSRHSSVIGAFNKNFVNESLFPSEFNKIVTRLFSHRQEADYQFDLNVIDREDALEDFKEAKQVVESLREFLAREGVLGKEITED